MRARISTSLAAAALTLPLLAGCGGGSTGAAPAASSSAPAGSAPAPASPAASSSAASPSASATPTTDPAAEKKAAAKAATTFLEETLTLGYPDKDIDAYAKRVKPLMTADCYDALFTGDTRKSTAQAVKNLTAQRARTVPQLRSDARISKLTDDSATAKIDYRNRAQLRDGDGWKVVKTSPQQTATISLVKDKGTWLVQDAR